jgi:Stealth protein CR2, conserved region 2/Stealth protein CR1, conserved region 1
MPVSSSVDIVYLWVDGNDAQWRQKRQKHFEALNNESYESLAPHSNVEGRYRNNEELRFSLRALEKFFPAHGHIYLVTDGQAPSWLKPSDRLTLIDHRELIPGDALPTFDSSNIESYIHHIPGLSERYFYLNDDVFFGAPVRLEDWFWEAGVYVSWSDDPEVIGEFMDAQSNSLENASRLSKAWLENKAKPSLPTSAAHTRPLDPTYRHTRRTFSHSPRPMLKSVLLELERDALSMFESVRSNVFRTWNKPTIISDFVPRWALAHGLAQLKSHSHLYISTGSCMASTELQDLQQQFGALDFFCINDTTDDAHSEDPRHLLIQTTLAKMLPAPSSHEV